MKKAFLALVIGMVATTAMAVSIEVTTFTDVRIGEVKTDVSEESTIVSVEFSGRGLTPLMHMLPKVYDSITDKRLSNFRGFNILQVPANGNDAKEISFQCETNDNAKKPSVPRCVIYITKGIIAG